MPARGEPRQRVFIARVFGDGLVRGGFRVGEAFVGDVQVGQQHLRRAVTRVHTQRALGFLTAVGELVPLQVRLAERHQHFGGERIDLKLRVNSGIAFDSS